MVVKIKKGLPKVVTASDLKDGLAVFLKEDGSWSVNINEAAVVSADDEVDSLLSKGQEAEKANIVVGAYLVDIEQNGASIKPVHIREYMRATGPSVREDLWNQSA